MMSTPDSTAIRTALWRALHLQVDSVPHIIHDDIGLQLAAPEEGWRDRPDMHPEWTKPFRASIIARARFIEDLAAEKASEGIDQYVILGAGLDTFAQRRPELLAKLTLFEVDQPGPQAWKRQRLTELGLSIPNNLKLVPVDFEARDSWLDQLKAAGFEAGRPSVVASTGVSMYLTREAILATMRQVSELAPGSTFAMSFIHPVESAGPEIRKGMEMAIKGAQASGTPFISFFHPQDIVALALEAGFAKAWHVPAADLAERYFAGRTDGLRPPDNAEDLLVATT